MVVQMSHQRKFSIHCLERRHFRIRFRAILRILHWPVFVRCPNLLVNLVHHRTILLRPRVPSHSVLTIPSILANPQKDLDHLLANQACDEYDQALCPTKCLALSRTRRIHHPIPLYPMVCQTRSVAGLSLMTMKVRRPRDYPRSTSPLKVVCLWPQSSKDQMRLQSPQQRPPVLSRKRVS